MANDNHKTDIDLDEAKAEIQAAERQHIAECGEALRELMQGFGCQLVTVPFISPQGTIGANILIQRIPEQP
jgi:hypothetical protein